MNIPEQPTIPKMPETGNKFNLIDIIAQKLNQEISSCFNCVIKINPVAASFLSAHLPFEYSEDRYIDKSGVYGTYRGVDIFLDEQLECWEINIEST